MKRIAATLAIAGAVTWSGSAGAVEAGLCDEFRVALDAQDSVYQAFSEAGDKNPVLNSAAVAAYREAAEAMKAARDKVEASLTDRQARAVLDHLVTMMGPSLALNQAIMEWKVARKRVVECCGLVERPAFPPLDRAVNELSKSLWAAYHETIKAACRLTNERGGDDR